MNCRCMSNCECKKEPTVQITQTMLIFLLNRAAEESQAAMIKGTHTGHYTNLGIAAEFAKEAFK